MVGNIGKLPGWGRQGVAKLCWSHAQKPSKGAEAKKTPPFAAQVQSGRCGAGPGSIRKVRHSCTSTPKSPIQMLAFPSSRSETTRSPQVVALQLWRTVKFGLVGKGQVYALVTRSTIRSQSPESTPGPPGKS